MQRNIRVMSKKYSDTLIKLFKKKSFKDEKLLQNYGEISEKCKIRETSVLLRKTFENIPNENCL